MRAGKNRGNETRFLTRKINSTDFKSAPLSVFLFLSRQANPLSLCIQRIGAGGCHGGSRRRENVSALRLLKRKSLGSGNVFQLLLWEPPVAPPRTLVGEGGFPERE